VTVLGGARPMPTRLGGRSRTPHVAARTAARPVSGAQRRRVSAPARAGRRTGSVRALIGVVLVAFLVGLIYLGQTVRLAALSYETDGLLRQRDDLARQVQTVETSVLRWGTEPTAVERGQKLGFDQLSTRVRLSAR
jgi:hypothetical protein